MKISMSKIALITLGVVLVLLMAMQFNKRQVGLFLAGRVIEKQMQRDLLAELPEGLHIGFCGTGSPMPDPTRAGPCVTVMAGQRVFVVDAGSGSTRNLGLMGIPVGDIEAALLTHYHSDHIADLGELMLQRWVAGSNTAPLPIIGPEGVGDVVAGFNAAYSLDQTYRTAHHGQGVAPPEGAGGIARAIAIGAEQNASAIVLDEDGLTITMFNVNHDPIRPAVGYRFDYKGRAVVISGDTVYSPSIAEHASGADILAHEGLQPALVTLINEKAAASGRETIAAIASDILDYHATPEEAAEIAKEAGVRHLVFYHMIPPLPSKLLYAAYLGDASAQFDGAITISEDGMIFSLPANGRGIEKRKGF